MKILKQAKLAVANSSEQQTPPTQQLLTISDRGSIFFVKQEHMVHRVPFQVRKKSRKWPYLGP